MALNLIALAAVLPLSVNPCTESLPKSYGHAVVDHVVGVYDGDTITVTIEDWPKIIGDSVGVRIAGVDTPEIRGKCPGEKSLAMKARAYTRTAVTTGKRVELRNLRRDKYFRILADVCVDGASVAQGLVDAGLGYGYVGKKKQSWCE
ncbi:thermonuclease family protein [Pseudomaricurvus alcaniphilus]|uniref:thermonuclease family protein n=1 Tax=Pseudomaricurvus alcaniphilus TaxID=1166482 RepID=UPI00140B0060|nr:thermonuclease family protein [Pseudomaricurvus alcaniphilus]NHN38952.1 thermonuclease family protein [Pseudomaricurvus alcaniphilus]